MEASIGAASSSWTIKTKNNNPIARYEPSLVTASDPFEDRLQAFATEPKTRRFLQGLHMQSVNELKRRNAERQARKASNGTSAVQSSPATTTETTAATATASPRMSDTVGAKSHSLSNNKDNRTISDEFKPFQFLNVNVLPPVEQKAWQTIRGDQSITYPHQWVRLASLFSIQSKTLRQPSLLTSQNELAAIEDCGGQKPLIESYMKIRDTQNRNYARNSVNEGIAAFKQKNVQGALNCYKRALDMDPKYAEGWFRVAEGLLYQKNKAEAIENLERALKADPSHAEAQKFASGKKRR
ncbi:hypothetical protein BX666DRAFT_2025811 [Dichotomocladium elegans]|nr:hypothetical protein BX666DRAFT_2025811 [Dichotomocladium elegans]